MKIMRISIFLSFVIILETFANGSYSQTKDLTLSASNVSLSQILEKIEGQSEFKFFYNNELIDVNKKADIKVKNGKIFTILNQIFDNTDITYRIVGSQIALFKKDALTTYTFQQPITVTGKVVDNEGLAIPGVNISIKGTTKGVVTDANGNYSIETEPDAILIYSFIGFVTQEVEVNKQTEINISLVSSSKDLEEIVVIGYGKVKKVDLTGSVSSVQAKDFTKGISNSALQLLNGKAAGVYVSQSSSAPGGSLSVRIRGAGSINAGNDVLVVVDGLPGASTQSISPDDIASIEVLKDASAAAIYGTRAANGVILITTKKGEKGGLKVNYETYFAYQKAARTLDVLNATEYMTALNDLSADAGDPAIYTNEEISAAGEGTNWQNEVLRPANAINHQLSLSGGEKFSTYYVSLNYFNQEGVVKESGIKKYNSRINYQAKPSDKFTFNMNLNLNHSITNNIFTSNYANELASPINTAIQFDPTLKPVLDDDGLYPLNPTIALDNPLALIYGMQRERVSNRVYGTLNFDYKILDELSISARLGADVNNYRNDNYNSRLTESGRGSGGIGSVASSEVYHWMSEYLLRYEKTFNEDHALSFVGGTTFEIFDYRYITSGSKDFISDINGTNVLGHGDGADGDDVTSGRTKNQLHGILGRLNYSYTDKYLLTLSFRSDGSSKFSEDNKYAFFPGVALAWKLANESFIANTEIFSDLKLRVSYGQLGQQAINNFETKATLKIQGTAILGDQIFRGLIPARVPNSDLVWETTEEYNVGLDFGVLKGRISGSVEYYIKNSVDQLFYKPLPLTSGFNSIRVNFGEVQNSGVDLMIHSKNFVSFQDKFGWETTLSFSTMKNEVIELPDFIPEIISGNIGSFTSGFTIVKEGAPMRSYYGYEVTGIFQEGDDIANSAQPSALPGHPIFKDTDGNGEINTDDRVILGSPFPDYTFSLNNTFTYKGFRLDVFFIGVQGVEIIDNNVLESLYPINFERNRIAKYYKDRWTPENPGAKYPSGVNPSSYGAGRAVNSFTISDASFIRLKSITLGYSIPTDKIKFLSSAYAYISGENLWTLTDYEGFDPDANSGNGTDVSGTGIIRTGYNNYPLNRTFRVGIRLGF